MRLVPAARQLIKQVTELIPSAKVEILDEIDGLGFQRAIRFDKATANKIGKTLDVIKDPRIAAIIPSSKGVKVVFVADTRADRVAPFEVAEVYAVLSAPTKNSKQHDDDDNNNDQP